MLQLPALISRKDFEKRSSRDNGRVAFNNSLAWQKYLLGPAEVLRRARSCSLSPKPSLDSGLPTSTLRSHASRQKIVHAFWQPSWSAPEHRRPSRRTTSSLRNPSMLAPPSIPEVQVFSTRRAT